MSAYDILPAKTDPYESVFDHNFGCGKCAAVLLDVFEHAAALAADNCHMTKEEFEGYVTFLASVHDVGKIHPVFVDRLYAYLPPEVKTAITDAGFKTYSAKSFRHEQYSGVVLERWLGEKYAINVRRNRWAKYTANVVTLHHDHKIGETLSELPSDCRSIYGAAQNEMINKMADEFHFPGIPAVCDNASEVYSFIESIIILADHISSAFGYDADFCAVIKNMGIGKTMIPESIEITELFPFVTEDSMRPLQKCVSKLSGNQRMVIIEDIPGAGKTEAAMHLAFKMCKDNNMQGIYFALPAAALSNQMYDRLCDMYAVIGPDKQRSLRLTHGTAAARITVSDDIISKESHTATDAAFLKPSRRALLSPSAVGTVDQIMMSALKVRFSCMRMLGLSNKTVIIDEIHAYDTYMSSVIRDMLEWFRAYEIPVILLSATLPTEKKKEYLKTADAVLPELLSDDYPLITTVDHNGNVAQTKVSAYRTKNYKYELVTYLNKPEHIASLAVMYAKQGGCIAVFANTVKDAQAIYRKVCDLGIEPILFHARYKGKDRNKIEKKVVSLFGKDAVTNGTRPKSAIVICTQVAEQSLDVDFDLVISQLCPIDLLIQRIGREHRFSETVRPEWAKEAKVIVLTGDIKKSSSQFVYAPYILEKTGEFLSEHDTIMIPGSIRKSVDYVYGASDIVAAQMQGYADEYAEYIFGQKGEANTALQMSIPAPSSTSYFKLDSQGSAFIAGMLDDETLEVSATTRLGDASVRVILTTRDQLKKYNENPHDKTLANELLDESLQMALTPPYTCIESGLLRGYAIGLFERLVDGEEIYHIEGSSEEVAYSDIGAKKHVP